jgi:GT2 family glycosyltransferase
METQPGEVDVEISVVSLGDVAQLSRCAATLPAACAGLDWRLTVVDNSPRGLELPTAMLDGIAASVVRSEGPRGFAANQNLVLAAVVAQRRARYVLILNDDTEVDPAMLARLVRHADGDPRLGAVSPAVRDPAGHREPDRFAWPGVAEQAARALLPRLGPRRAGGSGWLNGAALLARTACLADVGLFDPSFFLFFEETDLCLRMVRGGWRLDVCRGAGLVHRRHGTTGQAQRLNLRVEQQMLRSRYLFFLKHRGRAAAETLAALTRCALALRAAKAAMGARIGGGSAAEARRTALVLWRLAAYAPRRPTPLESPDGRPETPAGQCRKRR